MIPKFKAWCHVEYFDGKTSITKWHMADVSSINFEYRTCKLKAIGEDTEHTYDIDIGDKCQLLMQAPILDKNGKELFENDIVQLPGNPDPAAGYPYTLAMISRRGMSFGFTDIYTKDFDSFESIFGLVDINFKDEDTLYVGNRFENPELLK